MLSATAGAQPGFTPIFNGRDLEGWEIDTPGLWQVRDGMLVGKHTGLKYNDFLPTKKHYRDFELQLEFRLVGGVGNSGIQFRSVPATVPHEVSGYQADIGAQYWGFDESEVARSQNMKHITRRQVILSAPLAARAAQTSPNDTIRIGVIGTGGRSRRLMKGLDSVPGARSAALADVWEGALAETVKMSPPGVMTTRDYRELLDRKDIDAVIIGSGIIPFWQELRVQRGRVKPFVSGGYFLKMMHFTGERSLYGRFPGKTRRRNCGAAGGGISIKAGQMRIEPKNRLTRTCWDGLQNEQAHDLMLGFRF